MFNFQSNFTKGEIDPQLYGRHDTDAYYQAVKTARNVLLIPQGGLRARYGMRYKATCTANGRLESFTASDGSEYVLLFTNTKLQVYKAGVLQTNLNGSGFDYVTITHTLAQIQEMDFIQSGDTFLLLHEDVAPHKFVTTSDTTWTKSTSFLTNVPKYDFNDASSPAGTAEVQSVVFTNAVEGDTFKFSLEGILTADIVYGGVGTAATQTASAKAMQEALQDHILLKGKSVTVAYSAGTTFTVTLDAGLAYPISVLTATFSISRSTVGAVRINTSVSTSGVTRAEDVWSATRGYPRTGTFHEGRLYFGGSKQLPQSVWGSNVNDYFNFRTGQVYDDNALSFTLDTDKPNRIQAIYSNKSLQLFTTDGEFYVSNSPITPSDIQIKPQTISGAKRVRPVTLEGKTLFIQKSGKSLQSFEYLNDFDANKSISISLLAPHLIKNPVQLVYRKNTSSDDANYVYIINTDGTVTVLNAIESEGIKAFTRIETDGNIKSIATSGDDIYYLVERTINGATVYYLEVEDSTLALDSAIRSSGLASTDLTGLSHLNGETIKVRALTAAEVADGFTGGAVQDDELVAAGSITLDATYDTIEAGIDYTVEIETLPYVMTSKYGTNAGMRRRIKRVLVDLYESCGVLINDYQVSDKTIGGNQFDAPQPSTRIVRMFLGGYGLEPTVTISRGAPQPLQIKSLGVEV